MEKKYVAYVEARGIDKKWKDLNAVADNEP